MDTEIDLTTASRDVLIAIIVQQQAVIAELQVMIERLERRIAELEGQAKPGGPPRMPGLKSSSGRQPPAQQQPRKQRRHGFARPRMTPTHRVEHVVESCPDCGTHLTGGWVQRTREVIELPVVPVQVTEHVFIARTCPACRRRCIPPAQLDGVALGRQRLGVNVLSRIATLREEGRLPIRSIQWYLRTVHQLRLSVGAIVSAIHQTAQQAQPAVAAILDRIRASPVVHADETGWRQNGNNGYVWTFSTPTERHFPCSSQGQALRRGRGKAVVDEALGESFSGVLVSDFYAAYHHYDGPKQRCWAHLLRDIHDLVALYPKDTSLMTPRWPSGLRQSISSMSRPSLCRGQVFHPSSGTTTAHRSTGLGAAAAGHLPVLPANPSWLTRLALQGRLCRRIERHIKELFGCVAEPDVLSDNNPAERSLRHVVISRKVSGGTRSERGTESKMTLASIFGTWRARGLNPLAACRQLLTSPRI